MVVDYFSKYPESCALTNKTAFTVITHLKEIFAPYGISQDTVSDNMFFASREFAHFAQSRDITVTTPNAEHPTAHVQAERCVQTKKSIPPKANEENRGPYLALLEYRNTPFSSLKYAPAQLLTSRLLRSKIPLKNTLIRRSN